MAVPDPVGLSVTLISAGQGPITGGWLSMTVTVKLHVASGGTPFDAVQVTVDIPTGKL
jgi:hypothetical protein